MKEGPLSVSRFQCLVIRMTVTLTEKQRIPVTVMSIVFPLYPFPQGHVKIAADENQRGGERNLHYASINHVSLTEWRPKKR